MYIIWWPRMPEGSPMPKYRISFSCWLNSVSFCLRYGASFDWQVQVSAHCPGHRQEDASLLGRAGVLRQFRYTPIVAGDSGERMGKESKREMETKLERQTEMELLNKGTFFSQVSFQRVSRKNVVHRGKVLDSDCGGVRTKIYSDHVVELLPWSQHEKHLFECVLDGSLQLLSSLLLRPQRKKKLKRFPGILGNVFLHRAHIGRDCAAVFKCRLERVKKKHHDTCFYSPPWIYSLLR